MRGEGILGFGLVKFEDFGIEFSNLELLLSSTFLEEVEEEVRGKPHRGRGREEVIWSLNLDKMGRVMSSNSHCSCNNGGRPKMVEVDFKLVIEVKTMEVLAVGEERIEEAEDTVNGFGVVY